MSEEAYAADVVAGSLSTAWAKRLSLSTDVLVGVGAFDAHVGAVGGQIELYYLSKVMGTSTCDMLVAPGQTLGDKLVSGICGQVFGSIIPGMVGMEAGQSACGDTYAWFRDLLSWSLQNLLFSVGKADPATAKAFIKKIIDSILPELGRQAAQVPFDESGELAIDWFNGRRTPDA